MRAGGARRDVAPPASGAAASSTVRLGLETLDDAVEPVEEFVVGHRSAASGEQVEGRAEGSLCLSDVLDGPLTEFGEGWLVARRRVEDRDRVPAAELRRAAR